MEIQNAELAAGIAACDARIAGEYASTIDRARMARIESRWPEIERAAGELIAAILARIPS